VDVEILARGTTGFTGADLENMVNQAALRAAIDGADSVTMKYLENARDKVLMGMISDTCTRLFISDTVQVFPDFSFLRICVDTISREFLLIYILLSEDKKLHCF
jgi:hypothetical protein